MPTIKIKNAELVDLNNGEIIELPKYVPQIINLANQNAQGTRPRVVGQLSELFPQFLNDNPAPTMEEWRNWYLEHYPDAIDAAAEKIFQQVKNLSEAIKNIDKAMVKSWVSDLVITKTYSGMYYQGAIIKKIAELEGKSYRLANPVEESQGIDGYIGYVPVSVKPVTYEYMTRLNETIDVLMIKYEVKKDGIVVEY